MMERILDEFGDFDDPPPVERDHVPHAGRVRYGVKSYRKKLQKHAETNKSSIRIRQRSSVGKRHIPITLATKA